MQNEDKASYKETWPIGDKMSWGNRLAIFNNIKSNFDLATIKCQLNNEKALFISIFKILPYYL